MGERKDQDVTFGESLVPQGVPFEDITGTLPEGDVVTVRYYRALWDRITHEDQLREYFAGTFSPASPAPLCGVLSRKGYGTNIIDLIWSHSPHALEPDFIGRVSLPGERVATIEADTEQDELGDLRKYVKLGSRPEHARYALALTKFVLAVAPNSARIEIAPQVDTPPDTLFGETPTQNDGSQDGE